MPVILKIGSLPLRELPFRLKAKHRCAERPEASFLFRHFEKIRRPAEYISSGYYPFCIINI